MPWHLLDPRRPVLGMSQPREEGTIPYMPELPLSSESILNYNKSIAHLNGIYTAPSGLESTCLVVAYGLGEQSNEINFAEYSFLVAIRRYVRHTRRAVKDLRPPQGRLRLLPHHERPRRPDCGLDHREADVGEEGAEAGVEVRRTHRTGAADCEAERLNVYKTWLRNKKRAFENLY